MLAWWLLHYLCTIAVVIPQVIPPGAKHTVWATVATVGTAELSELMY